jgi:oxygen-independent coproporphyrinogen-3 oxidase
LAGIYLHIPFCKQACTYCNFHFTTSLRYKDQLVQALKSEIVDERNYLGGETVHTIYFGGGTPSLLSVDDCTSLLNIIREHFSVDKEAEITLEANPDDIDPEKLEGWRNAGINRLSIGVQSFFEEELRWMNRAHNAQQALQCIEWSHQQGFNNLSIDLIYGSPLLTDEMWQQNVDTATSLGTTHLSCYALTVEERTPLYKQIRTKTSQDVDSDKQARQFIQLMKWLRERGYEHYEVSNFAKPGFRSRHNSSYWKGEKYLGIGPSAHSYNGTERRWNIPNNLTYIKGINQHTADREVEALTAKQQLNEYIMISLRTKEGMDLNRIENNFGPAHRSRIEKELKKFNGNLLIAHNSVIQLTDQGMLMADGIASDLFLL